MSRDAVQQKKLSRAALEVLAIIAYHQPVTRAEIEDIRGVETSKGTLDTLMETEWVRMRGRRRTPGRPVTYGTTEKFLDHFGLEEVRDLPGIEELKGAGLLSARMPSNFAVPLPPADPDELTEDEDPLTDIDLEELGLLTPRVRMIDRKPLSKVAFRLVDAPICVSGPHRRKCVTSGAPSYNFVASSVLKPNAKAHRSSLRENVRERFAMGSFSIWHWLIVLVVVLLVFGRGKIPELMGDMAKGIKSFKKGMSTTKADDDARTVEHRADETVAAAKEKATKS